MNIPKRMLTVSLLLTLMLLLVACSRTQSKTNTNPALPAGPAVGGESGGGEGGGGEGGGAEGPSGPTLTNPGGLPPAPQTNNPALAQLGEERMIKVQDTTGQYSILFVDSWTQGVGSEAGSLRSSQDEWYAEVTVVPANSESPKQAAQDLDASQANGVAGYKKLALQTGDVHGLPAASLIYEYESGNNPVTGKPLRFIASQVFIGGGPPGVFARVTFSAPYTFYGDLSEVFDKILAGFVWLN